MLYLSASLAATTYPIRIPAKPYALENVRNKKALANCCCNANVSGKSAAVTNSTYASSIITGYHSVHVLKTL